MNWKDWLTHEMIPGAPQELTDLNSSITGMTNSKTDLEKTQSIYQGIQGVARTNLEARLNIKKSSFTAGTRQPVWQSNHSYTLGSIIRPTTPTNYVYIMTLPDPGPGTSGGIEPTWPTTPSSTVVDNEITWQCLLATIDIVYGGTYNVTNISDWTIEENPGSYVLYQYLGTGWDSDEIITKAVSDWSVCYSLLTDEIMGVNNMISRMGSAITLITNQKNLIQSRNNFLGDYD